MFGIGQQCRRARGHRPYDRCHSLIIQCWSRCGTLLSRICGWVPVGWFSVSASATLAWVCALAQRLVEQPLSELRRERHRVPLVADAEADRARRAVRWAKLGDDLCQRTV